jgi:hypothetical protein
VGLPEVAPEYRKQLAKIVKDYLANPGNIDECNEQMRIVFLDACKNDHIKLPQEALIRGSVPTIARITKIDPKYIKHTMSNNGKPIFYNFIYGYIALLGEDIHITNHISDFPQLFLRVILPEAIRIQKVIPTSSDNPLL